MIEGWVDAARFEPNDGGEWPEERGGWFGSGNDTSQVPTYCSGKLAAGTRIVTRAGMPWATGSREIEGIFVAGKERHQLPNFLGPYDAFCGPYSDSRDARRHQACLKDAEVRAEDVKLGCPVPKGC